jgi:hypothetical protein
VWSIINKVILASGRIYPYNLYWEEVPYNNEMGWVIKVFSLCCGIKGLYGKYGKDILSII